MDFSTLPFLFVFFPIFLTIWIISKPNFRPAVILIASLGFIFLGQKESLLPLAVIVLTGYGLGRAVEASKKAEKNASLVLWAGVILILAVLFFQKWWVAYGATSASEEAVKVFSLLPVLGLSYVTFQMTSYLVDISRGSIPAETNIFKFGSYLLFFPKLVSGPLMRYKPFRDQAPNLDPSLEDIAAGIRRILSGVVKRLLIANQLGLVANSVFGLDTPNIAPHFAWLGLIAYTFQIYFDFSGYTDIAIGLGRIMGMTLPENFNFPYTAQSIGDFWRRWHMTLSAWFREYVFFPLERRRTLLNPQQVNMLIVFVLTGIWHGLTWNFVIWGGIHGIAIAVESLGGGKWMKSIWQPIRHITTMGLVMLGWIFFRSNSLDFAFGFIGRLFGNVEGITPLPFSQTTPLPFIEPSFVIILVFAVIFSLPVSGIWNNARKRFADQPNKLILFQMVEDAFILGLFALAIAASLSGSFQPNIYAKF
jgi:alginate O-acetyltransferase complex protein AlgI